VNIRHYHDNDYSSLAHWWDKEASDSWPIKSLPACLAKSQYAMQVVDVSGDIRAACLFSVVADQCELLFIAVNPTQKRQGMALQLLHSLINHCRTMVVENIFLEVRESNFPAIALYRAAGFLVTGRRENYYPFRSTDEPIREAALIFQLAINPR
tara:strand:+ start:6767 stop:7228 length:462 start_codon:yes stop_codon:yes gene_type:complete